MALAMGSAGAIEGDVNRLVDQLDNEWLKATRDSEVRHLTSNGTPGGDCLTR